MVPTAAARYYLLWITMVRGHKSALHCLEMSLAIAAMH
jgi:hypothetical protein